VDPSRLRREYGGLRVRLQGSWFQAQSREIAYYVRAIQGPTPAVNAGGVRCEVDEFGNCISANPCYGDYQTPPQDDCPWPVEERAWSSPIWVKP